MPNTVESKAAGYEKNLLSQNVSRYKSLSMEISYDVNTFPDHSLLWNSF